MTVLVEKSATTLEDGIKTLIDSAITDYKKRYGDGQTPQWKKEQMFVQLLEGLHESEAELLVNAKDKKLHQIYKGLSTNVVCEAFNWNDNFMLMS